MFFQVDDQFQVNPKARALAERLMDDDPWGLAAIGLWTMCGSNAQAALSDGIVTRADLARLTLNPAVAMRAVGLLVEVGLWHAHGHGCERCPELQPGAFVFHDWFDLKYDRGEQVKTTRRKRKELQDPNLIAQVWARDCSDPPAQTRGDCRYCGKTLKRKDRRSVDAWQLDHVDPAKAIGPSNVVLACAPCNRSKGRRTPEIAGMKLRRAPRHAAPQRRDDAMPVDSGADRAERLAGRPQVDRAAHPPAEVDGRGETAGGRDDAMPVDSGADRAERLAGRPQVDRAAHRPGPGSEAGPGADPPGQSGIRTSDQSDISLIPDLISDCSELSSGARAGARVGQGLVGEGTGRERKGQDGQGSAGSGGARQGRRRRKRRSRGQPRPDEKPRPPSRQAGAAGACPEVDVAGQFGSPWYGFRGGPVTDELECPEHGLPAPCRLCVRGES